MKNPYSSDAIKKIMPEKLKEFRKNAGLTIEEVGIKLNKTKSAISSWEKGKALPDVNTLLKLSELYNVADINLFLEHAVPIEMPALTKTEQEHLKLWRLASQNTKTAITTLLRECSK
ncbi:helix-turn-helix transcriptional regulator [bacterium]|nr:helix-turn-helix transcriptional regulator [bacterium]